MDLPILFSLHHSCKQGISGYYALVLALLSAGLALVAVAELLIAYSQAIPGLLLYIALLFLLSFLHGRARSEKVSRLSLVFMLVPPMRIVALAMPLGHFPPLTWYLLVTIPLVVPLCLVSSRLQLSRESLGLTGRQPGLQILFAAGGPCIGMLTYSLAAPQAVVAVGADGELWMWVAVILLCTGLFEELIYRGVLQASVWPVLGWPGIVYVALIFACLHIYRLSLPFLAFSFGIGLLFSYVTRRSGSLLGVALNHGLANVTMFVVLPNYPGLAGQAVLTLPFIIATSALCMLLALTLTLAPGPSVGAPHQRRRIADAMLRKQRRSSGLLFTDLAMRTGLPARVIAEIEYGLCDPQPEQLRLIISALDTHFETDGQKDAVFPGLRQV